MRDCEVGKWYRLQHKKKPEEVGFVVCIKIIGKVDRKYRFKGETIVEIYAEDNLSSWYITELTELEKALV